MNFNGYSDLLIQYEDNNKFIIKVYELKEKEFIEIKQFNTESDSFVSIFDFNGDNL